MLDKNPKIAIAQYEFILANSPFYYNFCFFSCSHSPLAFDDPRSSKGDCGLPCEDVCVREGDSFRCDCSEVGKFLQSDGISCRSKYTVNGSNQGSWNNTCSYSQYYYM